MGKRLRTAALALLLLPATACYMTPRTANGLARAALFTTIVAANVAILSAHDAHYHSYYCGHHHHWRDGRWVYYYGGHWEYYESGAWYYYAN